MSTVCAVFLAAVFLLAAVSKLFDRAGTAASFADLGLPGARVLATAVPVVELATAVTLLLHPGWGGVAAFALLLGFTVVLVTVIRSGRLVPCRCFGGTSDAPVTWAQVVRNGWLALVAAVSAAGGAPETPTLSAFVVAGAIIGLGGIAVQWAGERFRVVP